MYNMDLSQRSFPKARDGIGAARESAYARRYER